MPKLNDLTTEELTKFIELRMINDRNINEENKTETNVLIHRLITERANLLSERICLLREQDAHIKTISRLERKLQYCKFNLKHIVENLD